MKPRSRCRKRLDSGSRLDSFLLPSPSTDGRCPNTGSPVPTPISSSARYSAIWRGRRRQQVLAAQHVRDAHERVVDRVDQRVQRLAVGAHDDEVRHRAGLERDLAAHQVREREVVVGHPQAQDRLAALGAERRLLLVGQVAVDAVVAELRVAAGGLVARLDLLRRGERLVRVAALDQAADDVRVQVHPLRLPVRLVRAAHLDALVPVQAEPAQRVEQLQVGLLRVARRVGVLDAEHERAARVARVRPVEQRRADQADVRRAGGRGAEADTHSGAGGRSHGLQVSGGAGRGCAARSVFPPQPAWSVSGGAGPGCAARRSPRPRPRRRPGPRSG